jgi:hypothetical protein
MDGSEDIQVTPKELVDAITELGNAARSFMFLYSFFDEGEVENVAKTEQLEDMWTYADCICDMSDNVLNKWLKAKEQSKQ